MSFEELSKKVDDAGLRKRTYATYVVYFLLINIGFFVAWYILQLTDNLWVQVANAIFFACVMVQAGMLGHDLSHQQVFKSKRLNRLGGIVVWGLYAGLSEGGWYDKHNDHHKYVNHDGLDPDLGVPFIFSEVQLENKATWVKKYIRPQQHWLFFVLLPLVYPNFIFWTFKRLFKELNFINIAELSLIVLHFAVFFFLPFYYLPTSVALVFLAIVLLVGGTYMGIIFAPNHKGEEVIVEDAPATWLHQITLTRNLNPSWLGFYFFGGLDLQVEHHLFPNVSRFNYPRIHAIVKEYCWEHNIRYYETSWLNSMREIYISLKENAK